MVDVMWPSDGRKNRQLLLGGYLRRREKVYSVAQWGRPSKVERKTLMPPHYLSLPISQIGEKLAIELKASLCRHVFEDGCRNRGLYREIFREAVLLKHVQDVPGNGYRWI